MEEVIRDLRRLAGYAAGLQELMVELEHAAPARSEGTDRSGAVQAILGRDGLPESIRVHSAWSDRSDGSRFAAAVAEAVGAAAQERGRAWAQVLEKSGWQERAGELKSGRARAPGVVPPAFLRGDAMPRPLDQLAEEAISLTSNVTSRLGRAPRKPGHGTGSNRTRTVTLTVAPGGQVSCQADPRWVAGKSGGQLTEALAEALTAARQDLAAAAAAEAESRNDTAGRQERLLAEIFAALKYPQSGI
jgi:hypothetical protein